MWLPAAQGKVMAGDAATKDRSVTHGGRAYRLKRIKRSGNKSTSTVRQNLRQIVQLTLINAWTATLQLFLPSLQRGRLFVYSRRQSS